MLGEVDLTVDQIWFADSVVGHAQARYAAFEQEFGFLEGTTGGTYQRVMTVQGSGFNVTGFAQMNGMSNRLWRWARNGENGLFSSLEDDNQLDQDHMVTFRIDPINGGGGAGGGALTTYLLFWEDLRPGQNQDRDFNDLVIEIQTSRNQVPEPATATVLAGAGLMMLTRRARRKNR